MNAISVLVLAPIRLPMQNSRDRSDTAIVSGMLSCTKRASTLRGLKHLWRFGSIYNAKSSASATGPWNSTMTNTTWKVMSNKQLFLSGPSGRPLSMLSGTDAP